MATTEFHRMLGILLDTDKIINDVNAASDKKKALIDLANQNSFTLDADDLNDLIKALDHIGTVKNEPSFPATFRN